MSETLTHLNAEKKQVRKQLFLTSIFGAVVGVLIIAQAWSISNIVDRVVTEGQSLRDVYSWLWLTLLVVLLRVLFVFASEHYGWSASAIVKQALRKRLLLKIRSLGPSYIESEGAGELATVVVESVEAIEEYYSRYIPAMFTAVFIPLAILVLVFPIDLQSGLIFLVTAPLIPFFMILIGKGTQALNQKYWSQLQRQGGHFLDVIQGLPTLKLLNASRREAKLIALISEKYRQSTMSVLRVAFLSSLALEFFATVSIALLAVTIGFKLYYGEMDFLSGFFILLLAPEFYLPLRSLGTHYHSRMSAIGAAEQIFSTLNEKTHENKAGNKIQFQEELQSVRFDSVSFAYNKAEAVLSAVNLQVKAGEHIALVGASGAGKSTIFQLLLGLIDPNTGTIYLNDVDMRQVDKPSWNRRIAWVKQQPRIFTGTIRQNLCLGLKEAEVDEAMILRATEQARAASFIQKLPDGLNTVVGDGGHGLSGGEIQRLALARAFLRNAELLLFDEATANLDSESERLIQDAIEEYAKGRTVITVAHRLKTVKRADTILVVDQGRILQQGKHSELVVVDGYYRQLLDAQAVQQ